MTTGTMTADRLAAAWCRMFNEQPDLAHDLVTDDFRIWQGVSTDVDTIRGRDDLAAYVRRHRTDGPGARFTPRVVAAGDDAFAYTWDAELRDGSVRSGIDLCTLRDGRIAENWSILGERRTALDPAGAGSATRERITELCELWSPLWNGDTGLAPELAAADLRIWFGAQAAGSVGDGIENPDAFAGFVASHQEQHGPIIYAKHRDLVIDAEHQRAAFTWTATQGARRLGGIDVFQLDGGKFAQVWSVTGARDFRW